MNIVTKKEETLRLEDLIKNEEESLKAREIVPFFFFFFFLIMLNWNKGYKKGWKIGEKICRECLRSSRISYKGYRKWIKNKRRKNFKA